MKKLRKLLRSGHPRHEMLVFVMMSVGLTPVCNGLYFLWSPFTVGFLNDDLIGGVLLADGILLLRWALSTSDRIYANYNPLVITAGLLALEATTRFCRGYVSGRSHMVMADFLGVIVLLFISSITGKTKKHNYQQEAVLWNSLEHYLM